jgi:hypothetical protein
LVIFILWHKCRDNSKDTKKYQYYVFHITYRMKIVYTRHQRLYKAVSRYRE